MAETLLNIQDVSKRFGGLTALDSVDLRVETGALAGLIGPNGSGKSTLFNIITGFLPSDEGSIRFRGEDVTGMPPFKIARLGLYRTFQMSLNPTQMTVMENMLLSPSGQVGESLLSCFLKPRSVKRQERENLERAREILDSVLLGDKMDEYVGNLSGGQKKLLALAKALMLDADLILLDEPVAGVNPALIEDIQETIQRLHRAGKNFLIVEHNMNFVRTVCDTVAVLDAGEIIASGDVEPTLNDPKVLEAYLAAPRGGDEPADDTAAA
ncbi:ABC transporter ATP-binding protein [Desulfohalovibrio reitneri]|uniref:ABC transporter ATP-binding protein n=1 Tax=Desulfohalovibrio reitneri TaxID=1307759 RepID=UPI00068AAEE9|nr:ABC transporter ATP-binding protein [Desulfohalovibrio reitneri]